MDVQGGLLRGMCTNAHVSDLYRHTWVSVVSHWLVFLHDPATSTRQAVFTEMSSAF